MRRSSHLLAGVLVVAVVAFSGRKTTGDAAAPPSRDALTAELGSPARPDRVRELHGLHRANEASAVVLTQALGDAGGAAAVGSLTELLGHRSVAVRREGVSAVVRV